MRRFGLILAVALAFPPAAGSVVVGFRTPSGNIGCVYASKGDSGAPTAVLRCDIRSRLKPLPPKPRRCDLDWGDSYEMGTSGRPTVTCHGDTTLDPRYRVVRYGSSWRRPGFVCASKITGLRCTNHAGHGFFLSRQHSYRF